MESSWILHGVMNLVPLLLSLTVHEYAHAWAAYRLGDDTAARLGRLTLNPIEHIDPIGTLLLPMLGIPFGWAKPVPTRPTNFTRSVSMRTGSALVAAAGPLSNLAIALVTTVLYALLLRFRTDLLVENPGVDALFQIIIPMNVGLAFFNALPIPPLDGHWIVESVLSARWQASWERFKGYSSYLLLGVVLGGSFLLAGPIGVVMGWLHGLLRLIVVGA